MSVPVLLFAGSLGAGADALYEEGVAGLCSIMEEPVSLDEAIQNGPALLERAVARMLHVYF